MQGWQAFEPVGLPVIDRETSFSLVSPVKQTTGYIVIPAFTINIEWKAWPRLVAQYNFITDKAFCFETWPISRISNDWMMVLSWRRGGGVDSLGNNIVAWKPRYQLWEDPIYAFKTYTQDIIHRYFSVEFWAFKAEYVTLPSDLRLNTSHRQINTTFTNIDMLVASNQALVTDDEKVTLPSDWPINISQNVCWLDNVGTWNELNTSSERSAGEVFPASYP